MALARLFWEKPVPTGATLRRRAFERIHPVLWAAHAIVYMAAINLQEVGPLQVARPLLLALLLALLLMIALGALLRSPGTGSLLATLFIILFFSYGHLYDLLKGQSLGSLIVGRHRYLLVAWLALALILGYTVRRLSQEWRAAVSRFMSAAALVALMFPLSSMVLFAARVGPALPWQRAGGSGLSYDGEGLPPDIYYIILDSYARRDVMDQLYGFDNREFERALEDRGFYVAHESVPNHVATGFSVASSLNMDYIPDLGVDLPPGSYPGPLIDPIRSSAVRQELEGLGYRTVATSSGWAATSILDADVFLTPERSLDSSVGTALLPPINNFESLLLETTLLRAPLDLLQGRQTNALLQRLLAVTGSERPGNPTSRRPQVRVRPHRLAPSALPIRPRRQPAGAGGALHL
jgi:hypothetical protein